MKGSRVDISNNINFGMRVKFSGIPRDSFKKLDKVVPVGNFWYFLFAFLTRLTLNHKYKVAFLNVLIRIFNVRTFPSILRLPLPFLPAYRSSPGIR